LLLCSLVGFHVTLSPFGRHCVRHGHRCHAAVSPIPQRRSGQRPTGGPPSPLLALDTARIMRLSTTEGGAGLRATRRASSAACWQRAGS
jgi:hypothetical protein